MDVLDVLFVAGAIAYISTAIVYKTGPFNIFPTFKHFARRALGDNTPFDCAFCASFWIGIVLAVLYSLDVSVVQAIIQLFGILGISIALRGASAIWD